MQRYLRTVSEQAERDKKKREEEERILQEIKEEMDLLLLYGNRRWRRASDSDSQGASGAQYLHPRVQTENMMTSHRPFTSFFENPPTTSHLPPTRGIPIIHAKPVVSLSVRSTTSEQQRLIKDVSERMSGSKSTQSEGVKMKGARDKVKIFLNELASEEVFENVDLKSLLR